MSISLGRIGSYIYHSIANVFLNIAEKFRDFKNLLFGVRATNRYIQSQNVASTAYSNTTPLRTHLSSTRSIPNNTDQVSQIRHRLVSTQQQFNGSAYSVNGMDSEDAYNQAIAASLTTLQSQTTQPSTNPPNTYNTNGHMSEEAALRLALERSVKDQQQQTKTDSLPLTTATSTASNKPTTLSKELIKKTHEAIDEFRKKLPSCFQNSCFVDAYCAYYYLQHGSIPKDFTEIIANTLTTLGDEQFDIGTYILLTNNTQRILGIQMDFKNQEEVIEDARQHNTRLAAQKTETRSTTTTSAHNQPVPSTTNQQVNEKIQIETATEHYSVVKGLSSQLTSKEITELQAHLNQYEGGCLILKRTSNSNVGHYMFYHPSDLFITGGTRPYNNGSSGITLAQLLTDIGSQRNTEFHIYKYSSLLENVPQT